MTCVPFIITDPRVANSPEDLDRLCDEVGADKVKVHGLTPFAARNAQTLADLVEVPCHILYCINQDNSEVFEEFSRPRWVAYCHLDKSGKVRTSKDWPHHHQPGGD